MRTGTFFNIPESPADVERVWQSAAPVTSAALPAWARNEPVGTYRLVTPRSTPASGPATVIYNTEVTKLHGAGLIIDTAENQTSRVYMTAPTAWSIGIYTGRSPFALAAAGHARNPVLTRDDVSDVMASVVADPFMLRMRETWFMFFEVFNWTANKGEIGLATSVDGLEWTYEQIVLAERFHLSYPYVFEWMNEYFLIPESHQAGAIRLYKARRFPTDWVLVNQLLEGPYFVDTSIIRHEEKWWLFTDASPERRHDTLRLYYADALAGPWRPHPTTPVVATGPHLSRPAGRVFAHEGTLYRFAQTCVPTYGTEVRALEISRLGLDGYSDLELPQSPVLTPTGHGWNAHGMHHIDPHWLGDGRWLACVDGWTRSGSPSSTRAPLTLCEGIDA